MKHIKIFSVFFSVFLFVAACAPAFAASAPATPQEAQIGNNLTNCVVNPAPCLNIPRLVNAWREAMSKVSTTAANWVAIFNQLIAASPMPTPNATTKATPFYNAPDSAVEVVPTKP